MGEIDGAAVQAFTKGRLQEGDPEVLRMLAAALSVARREVGWHVSPVRQADSVTIDGPGRTVLWLPTRKIAEPDGIISVTEDDVLLDPGVYGKPSAGDGPGLSRPIALRKKGGRRWSCEYGAITVVMDHGYTEVEAADWRQAILSMVDEMSLIPISSATGVSGFGLKTKEVDDVQYQWGTNYAAMAEDVMLSYMHILDDFRLPEVEFY